MNFRRKNCDDYSLVKLAIVDALAKEPAGA